MTQESEEIQQPDKKEEADFNKLQVSDLDAILKFLYKPNELYPIPFSEVEAFIPKLTKYELSIALDKLTKDKNIEVSYPYSRNKVTNEKEYIKNDPRYYISYEGYFFLRHGGYVGQAQRNQSEADKVNALQKSSAEMERRLYYLTVAIAAGAVIASIYYSIEIYQFFYSLFHAPSL